MGLKHSRQVRPVRRYAAPSTTKKTSDNEKHLSDGRQDFQRLLAETRLEARQIISAHLTAAQEDIRKVLASKLSQLR